METLELGKIGALLIGLISTYGIFVLFFGTFFLGENVILVAFILAAQGYIKFNHAIPIVFLGSLSADLFWYFFSGLFLSKYQIQNFIEDRKNYLNKLIHLILKKPPLLVFTFIKFLVGIRLILTLAFIMMKKISFGSYLLLCVISNTIFISALYGIALLTNKGINVLPFYHNVSTVLAASVCIMVLLNLLPRVIGYLFNKYK